MARVFRAPTYLSLLGACLLLLPNDGHCGTTFAHPLNWETPGVAGVGVGDMDNDGDLDFLVARSDINSLRWYRGRGDGTFSTNSRGVGFCPVDALLADFDGDGVKDAAVAKACPPHGLEVLTGTGTWFFNGTQYAAPTPTQSVVAGDFNGDQITDLLGIGTDGLVLLGNGDATFTAFAVDGGAAFAAVADFDEDGLDDYAYAVEAADVVRVYLSNADGSFDLFSSPGVGDEPQAVAAADVSGDGFVDLVVPNRMSDDVSVLLGNGDGTFAGEQRYPLSPLPGDDPRPTSIGIADLNGDDLPDLVVANSWVDVRDPSLFLLHGTGGGVFDPAVVGDDLPAPARELALADFDRDGQLDLLRSHPEGMFVSWLFGDGEGGFDLDFNLPVGQSAAAVAVGDLDDDGRADIVSANEGSHDVSVLLAESAERFAPEQRSCVVSASPPCPSGDSPTALAIGQVTGDLHVDVVALSRASDRVLVLRGDGAGGLSHEVTLDLLPGTAPSSVAIGDLDLDGNGDLMLVGKGSSQATVLLGDGSGGFAAPPASPQVGSKPAAIVLGLIDGGNTVDAIVANSGGGATLLLGNGDGSFSSQTSGAASIVDVALGDVNGDQDLDRAFAVDGGGDDVDWVPVQLGNGDGTFGLGSGPGLTDQGDQPSSLHLADADADSGLDVFVTKTLDNLPGSVQHVIHRRPNGSFSPREFHHSTGRHQVLGDFNLDTRPDVVSAGEGDRVRILINRSGPAGLAIHSDRQTLEWRATAGGLTYNVYRGLLSDLIDDDDDGLADAGYGECVTGLDTDTRDTFLIDPLMPTVAGAGLFYLVSVVDAGGEQGPGTNSSGLVRVPAVPCP